MGFKKRISDEAEALIHKLLREGVRAEVIAERAGVSAPTVFNRKKAMARETAVAADVRDLPAPRPEPITGNREELLARYRNVMTKLDYATDKSAIASLEQQRDAIAAQLGALNKTRMAAVVSKPPAPPIPNLLPPTGADDLEDEDAEDPGPISQPMSAPVQEKPTEKRVVTMETIDAFRAEVKREYDEKVQAAKSEYDMMTKALERVARLIDDRARF